MKKKMFWILALALILAIGAAVTSQVKADGLDKYTYLPAVMLNSSTAPTPEPTPVPSCGYRQPEMGENPDNGILLDVESVVIGPAIVRPIITEENPSNDELYVLAIYPNIEYVTEMPSQAWLYNGDITCLQAQYQYFSGYSIIEIK